VSDINRGLHGSEKAASSITVEGAVTVDALVPRWHKWDQPRALGGSEKAGVQQCYTEAMLQPDNLFWGAVRLVQVGGWEGALP
jgi:hypothetical protein